MKIKLCPICIGVSSSWLLLQFGVLAGFLPLSQVEILIAILMGMSVVGIAYQGENRIPAILVGLPLAYWFASNITWINLVIEIVILAFVGYIYLVLPAQKEVGTDRKVSAVEEKLKKCC